MGCESKSGSVDHVFFDEGVVPASVEIGDSAGEIINIFSPLSNAIYHEGDVITILWETTGDIGGSAVKIGYSLNGGMEWTDLDGEHLTTDPLDEYCDYNCDDEGDYDFGHWSNRNNDGNETMIAPSIQDTTHHMLIGIWSSSNPVSQYKIIDEYITVTSDSNYYRILFPNGGELFEWGDEIPIIWESGGDVGTIDLYYSLFGGSSWYSIYVNPSEDVDDGLFNWEVITGQFDNPNCLIKIVDQDNSFWNDISDATFSIVEESNHSIGFNGDFIENNWEIDSGCRYSYGHIECDGDTDNDGHNWDESGGTYTVTTSYYSSDGGVMVFDLEGYLYSNCHIKFYIDSEEEYVHNTSNSSNIFKHSRVYEINPGFHTFRWEIYKPGGNNSSYFKLNYVYFP